MARAPLRPCSVPGCPALQPEARCAKHRTELNRHRRQTTPTKRTEPGDRARRRAAVEAHRQRYGNWCPGWGVEAHRSADLTADHITAVAQGDPSGPLQVLCRACNGRKSDRPNPVKSDTRGVAGGLPYPRGDHPPPGSPP